MSYAGLALEQAGYVEDAERIWTKAALKAPVEGLTQ